MSAWIDRIFEAGATDGGWYGERSRTSRNMGRPGQPQARGLAARLAPDPRYNLGVPTFIPLAKPLQLPTIGRTIERPVMDWKVKPAKHSFERAKDVAAFANHLGGTLLIGAHELNEERRKLDEYDRRRRQQTPNSSAHRSHWPHARTGTEPGSEASPAGGDGSSRATTPQPDVRKSSPGRTAESHARRLRPYPR